MFEGRRGGHGGVDYSFAARNTESDENSSHHISMSAKTPSATSASSLGSAASILKDSSSHTRRRTSSSLVDSYGFRSVGTGANDTMAESSSGCGALAGRVVLGPVDANTRLANPPAHALQSVDGNPPLSRAPHPLSSISTQGTARSGRSCAEVAAHSRAPSRGIDKQVLFRCLQRIVLEGTMLGRYFSAWLRYHHVHAVREYQLGVLQKIRRAAHVAMVRRCFAKLKRLSARKRAVEALPHMAAAAALSLGQRAFLQWRYFHHLISTERRTAPILARIERVSRVQLAVDAFKRWAAFRSRQQRLWWAVEQLEASTEMRRAADCFRLWQRRRFASLRGPVLAKMGRRLQREGVRHCLRLWIMFAIRRQVAKRLEQFHLYLVARRHFLAWQRPTVLRLKTQALVEHTNAETAGAAFVKWFAWLQRRVTAEKEAQKALVLLLRRYFLTWRRSHTRSQLSYGAFMNRKRTASEATLSAKSSRTASMLSNAAVE